MSNGRNRLLGISRLNFFSSLILLAGKQHSRNFAEVNLCFSSEGLEHKWTIRQQDFAQISKRMIIIIGHFLLFAAIMFQKYALLKKTRSNFNINFEFLLHRSLFRVAISVSNFLCGFTMTKLCANIHTYKYFFLLFYQLT